MKTFTFTRGAVLTGALMLIHAGTALAAGGESTPLNLSGGSTPVTHTSSAGSSLARTIVGLFVVIVVIYGVAWILRRFKSDKKSRPSGQGLSHVATLPLGGGRSVALVRAGRDVVLVGIAENSVTPIRRYSEAEALANGIELPSEDAPSSIGPGETSSGGILEALRRLTVRS